MSKRSEPFDVVELGRVLASYAAETCAGGHRPLPPGLAARWSAAYGVPVAEVAAAASADGYRLGNRAVDARELAMITAAAAEAGVDRSAVDAVVDDAVNRVGDGPGQRPLIAAAALAAVREGAVLGGRFVPATPSPQGVDAALEGAGGVTASAVRRPGKAPGLPTRRDGSIDVQAVQASISKEVLAALGHKPRPAAAASTAVPDGSLYGAGAGD